MSSDIGIARELTAKWYYKELWDWNLDKICTGPVREVFLKSLMVCANGDGELTAAERSWVIGRAAAGGAPDSLLNELRDYEANEDINTLVSSTLATNKSRGAVVYFAIKAASADGEYHGDERDAVRNAAASMDIPLDTVEQIESICAEEERLKAKRISLCFPDGNPFDSV
jgi:hypothetical protein